MGEAEPPRTCGVWDNEKEQKMVLGILLGISEVSDSDEEKAQEK